MNSLQKKDNMIIPLLGILPTTTCDDTYKMRYRYEHVECLKRNFSSIDGDTFSCIMVSSLDNQEYKLKTPIYVNVKHLNSEFIAEYPSLGIYEYSEKFEDVIKNVKNYIVNLYSEIASTPDKNLSPELVAQKKYLKEIVLA